MRKLLSVLSSTLQGGVRGGLLFLALLATINLWAYDFQYGELYYNITSDTTVEVTYQSTSSSNYSGFTSVTIPETITCNGTTYSVTSIGEEAFYWCYSLTSITIPNSVTSIGDWAFGGCCYLTSVTIPNSVTSIGNGAFEFCSSLTSIAIPNSVTSIGEGAFRDCSSLTSSTIPNSVMSIGEGAFNSCDDLISIVVESGNSTYDSRENCNAIIETATNTLIAGCKNTVIPNSVTSIGEWAFGDCSSLTSITIPNSVTSIGDDAFVWCSALTSVTIGNSVTSIGYRAFGGCSSITSITIPNSITRIGDAAFYSCSSLTSVTCEAVVVPVLDANNVFSYVPQSTATLYVPAESLDDYKAADQWKDFGTILPIEGETEEEIKLQDTDMTIVFTNSEDNDSEIYRETITIKVPTAPTIAGFTFLYWQPVAEPITNEITIQAIYEADTPTSAEVYTNPANPTQKLLRNGQVYILQDGKTYTITGQKL